MARFRPIPRRHFLQGGLGGLAAAMASRLLPGCGPGPAGDVDMDAPPAEMPMADASPDHFRPNRIPRRPALISRIAEIGPLGAADANGVLLAPGFTARIVAQYGTPVAPTSYAWHIFPDGGATYNLPDGGWIYVSNSEIPSIGGVSALRFDRSGAVTSAYRILERSHNNCAGGPTPWGSWLSCEEISEGQVWECDPLGVQAARPRPALGVFKHEAVAVDPVNWHLYLSEDERDGKLYRFVPAAMAPTGFPDLSAGRLEAANVAMDGTVRWLEVPDPQLDGNTPTRYQIAATPFDGGEGIWYHEGVVYLSTKGDNRIWALDLAASRIGVLYDYATSPMPLLHGVDNITVSCCGDVLVAEDGGAMQIVAILPDGSLKPLVQIVGQDSSEITGPAFDPSGTRLYFSSQRGGPRGGGITYVVEGPFHAPNNLHG